MKREKHLLHDDVIQFTKSDLECRAHTAQAWGIDNAVLIVAETLNVEISTTPLPHANTAPKTP